MIKLSNIVRVSVLAVALAAGAAISAPAFAYDQDDLDQAMADDYSAGNDFLMIDGIRSAMNPPPNFGDDSYWYQYNYMMEGCVGNDPWYINDCKENAEEWLQEADDLYYQWLGYQAAMQDADNWVQYVANHQNGIHGQP